MKKFFAFIFAVLLLLSLSACSGKRPKNIPIENTATAPPESVTLSQEPLWPENEYTHGLPLPPCTVSWTITDSARKCCGIQIRALSREQFDTYYQTLLNSGFAEIEKIPGGGKYISLGSIVSNRDKSISLAFSESVLMMTITKQPVDGSARRFWEIGNLTNVYVNAYSTYNDESGVQVITELYVPDRQTPAPLFTGVTGLITVTVAGNTTTHYLGCTADSTSTLGLALSSNRLGNSGDKGTVIIAGTAHADNAAAGSGSFCLCYEITLP